MIFKTNYNAKRHIMIHTGEKPFHCQYCNYSAVQRSDVRSHMRTNHKQFSWFWLIYWNRLVFIHGLIVFRIFHFAWVPNNLAVSIVQRFSKLVPGLEGMSWFIQEKNHLLVIFVIILEIKNLTWTTTWKNTTIKMFRDLIYFELTIISLFTEQSNSFWPKPICLPTLFNDFPNKPKC